MWEKKKVYVHFDWAAKYILRDKANFCVLEGLLEVILGEKIIIEEILESEGNQVSPIDKFNRVDIKARNSKNEIILVEIQNTREMYFMERVLYGVSKSITENISMGHTYAGVEKVYNISIIYFDLGKGEDYLYHGRTDFKGVNTNDELLITTKEKSVLKVVTPADIFPEYFLIRVKAFKGNPKNPLEEWIEYLKTGEISETTTAPGLKQAKERLEFLKMDDRQKRAYEHHWDQVLSEINMLDAAREDGWIEGMEKGEVKGYEKGLEKGLAKGREKGEQIKALEIARQMKELGLPMDIIKKATGINENGFK